MTDAPFVSYAGNREDVVLWRALRGVAGGRYLEIDPDGAGRTTLALAERGWRGTVTVGAHGPEASSTDRPDDVLVASDAAPQALTSWHGALHLLVIGPGSGTDALLTVLDGRAVRPWVVVAPPELEARLRHAGYEPAVFDGVSRFFHAEEHPELATPLGHPSCALDDVVDAATADLIARNADLLDQLQRWRGRAVSAWAAWEPPRVADWSVDDQRELESVKLELTRMQQTLSWRVTRPIRAVRRRMGAS